MAPADVTPIDQPAAVQADAEPIVGSLPFNMAERAEWSAQQRDEAALYAELLGDSEAVVRWPDDATRDEKARAEGWVHMQHLAGYGRTEAEATRIAEQHAFVSAVAHRVDAMLRRRAHAQRIAVQNGNRRPDTIMVFWWFEQQRFHRWMADRFRLTVGDVRRVALVQERLERQVGQQLRHHAPAAVIERARQAQLERGAAA